MSENNMSEEQKERYAVLYPFFKEFLVSDFIAVRGAKTRWKDILNAWYAKPYPPSGFMENRWEFVLKQLGYEKVGGYILDLKFRYLVGHEDKDRILKQEDIKEDVGLKTVLEKYFVFQLHSRVPAAEIYAAWCNWCGWEEAHGRAVYVGTKKHLGMRLRYIPGLRRVKSHGRTYYVGLQRKEDVRW